MCGNLGLLLAIDARGKLVITIVPTNGGAPPPVALKKPAEVLREMVAATEIRGGQAGGISAFEFSRKPGAAPTVGRVRAIARKYAARPLARVLRTRAPVAAAVPTGCA